MRGEHCVAGASAATLIAIILMVFAHIGQINPTSLPKGIYYAQVDIAAYGAGLQGATKTSVGGLYDTQASDALGKGLGLRQQYRWGLYDACAYVKGGAGNCNGTAFGYGFQPMAAILSDTPTNFHTQTSDIIPPSTFKDNSYNNSLSKAAFWTIFIGSCAALLAFIFGLIPHRLSFLVAAVCASIASLGLLIGAAIWTAIIKKDAFVNIVHVENGGSLGIYVTAGPALYLTWVAFALITLTVIPYAISCCTFRKS